MSRVRPSCRVAVVINLVLASLIAADYDRRRSQRRGRRRGEAGAKGVGGRVGEGGMGKVGGRGEV